MKGIQTGWFVEVAMIKLITVGFESSQPPSPLATAPRHKWHAKHFTEGHKCLLLKESGNTGHVLRRMVSTSQLVTIPET